MIENVLWSPQPDSSTVVDADKDKDDGRAKSLKVVNLNV